MTYMCHGIAYLYCMEKPTLIMIHSIKLTKINNTIDLSKNMHKGFVGVYENKFVQGWS
jgi:hypothetical protein